MTAPMPGWFGLTSHVTHVLATMGADRDPDGRFLVAGIAVGIDPRETVVPGDAVYFVDGQPRNLALAMNGTSYGVRGIVVL